MMAASKTESEVKVLPPNSPSMVTIERSIQVATTLEAATALINDSEKFSMLFSGVEKATPDELYPHPGGTMQIHYKVAGLHLEIDQTVIEERLGLRKVSSQMRIVQFAHLRPLKGFNTFAWEEKDGGVLLTFTYEYEPPHYKAGKDMERWMVRRFTAASLERSLKNIKEALEKDAALS
jgi:hypothetical protein